MNQSPGFWLLEGERFQGLEWEAILSHSSLKFNLIKYLNHSSQCLICKHLDFSVISSVLNSGIQGIREMCHWILSFKRASCRKDGVCFLCN